jgi:hypothetical protein
MNDQPHPFLELRRKIRYAGKQFRRDNDNSQSLFHPRGGFVNAYDIDLVEAALDEYEQSLPLVPRETPLEAILRLARRIENAHPSTDARELAHQVLTFLYPLTKPPLYERGGSSVYIIDWEGKESP